MRPEATRFRPVDAVGFLSRIPGIGGWVLLIFQRRRELRAAAALVAAEFEYNADTVEPITGGYSPANIADELRYSRWETEGAGFTSSAATIQSSGTKWFRRTTI
jgi:hypothetical protein